MGKFDPTMLSKTLGDHVGQLIAVQFNFRGKDIRHIKPNWYQVRSGSRSDGEAEFSNVRVSLRRKTWRHSSRSTMNTTSATRLTLYGRVERDADNHFYFVHVLGGKATLDSSGNASVSW